MTKARGSPIIFLKQLDVFGQPHPNFMFKGRAKYKTWYGAAATIIVFVLLLFFFIPKLIHMSGDYNPRTSVHTQ